jgi:hypothetical protein
MAGVLSEDWTVVNHIADFTLIIESIVTNPQALDWGWNRTLVGLHKAFNLSGDDLVYRGQYLLQIELLFKLVEVVVYDLRKIEVFVSYELLVEGGHA